MSAHQARDIVVGSLAYSPATPQQRRLVLLAAALLFAAFSVTVPFAGTTLPRLDAFTPTVEGIIFVNYLITSILLFGQYSVTRSRAILALASGYLFTALTVVTHMLAFPGAFTPRGLLAAGLQSAPWLYFFWHLGFPVSVLGYACLRQADTSIHLLQGSMESKVGWCIASVVGLVCGLTWLATAGERFLPIIFIDDINVLWANLLLINSLTLLVVAAALAVMWMRRSSVLDYWLMLALVAMISELVLSNALNSTRFSLGYYAGRAFSLATSILVLGLLLEEMTTSYARLARTNVLIERERNKNNTLMNVEVTTAAIAHEIKQPLTVIVGNAQACLALLEGQSPDVPEAKEALKEIAAAGLRTSETLDGIRSMFGKVDRDRELVDMNEIALEVLRSLGNELRAYGIVTQPRLTADIPRIHGNRSQLQQVVFNLVNNAIEAMSTTTDRKRVLSLITEARDRDAILVAVRDSGPGIDPERLHRIFDAFETTKSESVGLGLAICRVIVERHDGQLSAYSDGRSGASFQVVLPAKSAH
jgi:signal transduction histidine kinase